VTTVAHQDLPPTRRGRSITISATSTTPDDAKAVNTTAEPYPPSPVSNDVAVPPMSICGSKGLPGRAFRSSNQATPRMSCPTDHTPAMASDTFAHHGRGFGPRPADGTAALPPMDSIMCSAVIAGFPSTHLFLTHPAFAGRSRETSCAGADHLISKDEISGYLSAASAPLQRRRSAAAAFGAAIPLFGAPPRDEAPG
jgi:hypothetical protein